MRSISTLIACGLLSVGAPQLLPAQEPHFGFALNLGFPTGEFRSRDIPASGTAGKQNEGFDAGFGGQFTISFPLEQALALRMNFNGQGTTGSRTESGHSNQDLQHNIFSLGAEMQIFVGGNANRHRGTYLFFGPSADFERWDYTYDGYWDSYRDTRTYDRKSRMGATFGMGHSFGRPIGRFTMEVGFHKTLSGNDVNKGEPPSSDFAKLSFGWVF
jgi:hypothetical protein